MNWACTYAQDGFVYECLEDNRLRQEKDERNGSSHSTPFGADIRVLGQICRKMHEETALLPFENFTWAFETAFTLDEWLSKEAGIPMSCKEAIRTVAVPSPGPYRSSERALSNLRELLLIGTPYSTNTYFTMDSKGAKDMGIEMEILRKEKASGAWVKGGARAQYAKDLLA